MVTVPWTKACGLCAHRRIKCDQTRPYCLRCLKQGRSCPGYTCNSKFRDESAKLRRRFKPHSSVREGHNAVSIVFHEPQSSLASCYPGQDWVRTGHPADTPANDTKYDFAVVQYTAPLGSPFAQQQQLLHHFIWSMTASHQITLSSALGTYSRWLPHLFPVTGCHVLLDQSVRACTLAHLSRMYRTTALMHEAELHYGRALRYLNNMLQDPVKGLESETLGSMILLSIFEMFASSSNQSWIRHAGGVETLMKLRGPGRHRKGIDREMFLAYRVTLVVQAIQSDRVTFLDEPEWRQLSMDIYDETRLSGDFPNALTGELWELSHLFFLETTNVCTLSYEIRHILQADNIGNKQVATITSKLLAAANSCRRTIRSLVRRLKTTITGSGYELTNRSTNDRIFPVQYDFVNMFVASVQMGLWLYNMRVDILLLKLERSPAKLRQFRSESIDLAKECCRCYDYMMTSSFLGPFLILAVLRRCLNALVEPKETTWVISKLTEIGESKLFIAKDLKEKK